MTDFYEFREDPNSPLLQAIKPDIQPRESPPPFATDTASSSSTEGDELSAARRRKLAKPSQGDTVLLNQLAPNHPDIAQRAGEEALEPASPSEAESMKEETVAIALPSSATEAELATKALHVASVDIKSEYVSKSSDGRYGVEFRSVGDVNSINNVRPESTSQLRRLSPKQARLQPAPIRTESAFDHRSDDETLASSPNLARYAITPSEPIASTLPALQTSPGGPTSVHSPENSHSLPSLKTALGEQLDGSPLPPLSATSPSMGRAPPLPPYYPTVPPGPSPSTYSQPSPASSRDHQTMSPPGTTASTNPSLWRTAPKSETSLSSTVSDSTTPSTLSHSPSNTYTTPSAQDARSLAEVDSTGMMSGLMGANGPFTSTTFKCTYPGCTAAPFQTQYLLNSHANVHSSSRPHYCPVKGCPRGLGGKGFKRKNEMIRHGLVHDSPGYVCPFCPDQQHKYPRPDNLQRHVRVHHVDKDKEDPLLREVLAQRPDGPSRGRRRRLGS